MMLPFGLRAILAPLGVFLCALLLNAQPRPALEQMLSLPFASDLTASPAGRAVAWVEDRRGWRNIWVAEAPAWKPRPLTRFAQDDGQEIGELSWSFDGSLLLFTRVPDLEAENAPANPLGLVEPPSAKVWSAFLRGDAAPRVLTDGRGAHAQPLIGGRVWYLRKDGIWSVSAQGSAPRREVAVQGTATDLTWSPDGRTLAFTNAREQHSFIAVFQPGSRALRFLEPTVDSDFSPVWSPDSTELAFVRQPASSTVPLFGARSAGYPWSIHVVNLRTGQARRLFQAAPGPGSVFHPLSAAKQLLWTRTDYILFPFEGTGFLHLNSVPAHGGAAVDETPGDGEVEAAALSNDGVRLLWAGNAGDTDRRHIWSRNLSPRGDAQQITEGDSIESAVAPLAGTENLAVLTSDWETPSTVQLVGGKQPHRLQPEVEQAGFTRPEPVTMPSADGLILHGQIFRPSTPGKHPALLFLHGGSRRQMLLGFHPMHYYSNAFAMNQYLASLGYLVLSLNYRSGTGYGLAFREAAHYGATGASEYQDVLAAGHYLRGRADVDASRIGLWGGSYGGYLTALGLALNSDVFSAGVDFHGVHDWNIEFNGMTAPGDAEARQEFERLALRSSPLASVHGWTSPVLFIHGDDDRTVAFRETIAMIEALRAEGREPQQLIFPNERHVFLLWADWLKSYQATADFFDHLLRTQ